MTRLVIFGDSWACGEWGVPDGTPDSYRVVHAGLGEYLAKLYKVENLAKGGSSLWDILHRINNYLALRKQIGPVTGKFLVFQTMITRFDRADEFDVDYEQMLRQHRSVKSMCENLLDIWYIKLQETATRYDVDFYMIGGLSDLDLSLMKQHDRLLCLCESWQKVLHPNHEINPVSIFPHATILKLAHENAESGLVEDFINTFDNNMPKVLEFLDLSSVGPVDHHPNRLGHELMANLIIEFFNRKHTDV